MTKLAKNVLAISHFNEGINRIFEDYCSGIEKNAKKYFYIDYISLFLENGKKGGEKKILDLIQKEKIDTIFFIWWSCDLSFDPRFLEKLRNYVRVVMNFYDTEYYFEGVDRYYAQNADLILLPDFLAQYRYRLLNIPVMTTFSLFDKAFYQASYKGPQDIDVSFIGNVSIGDRTNKISFLRKKGVHILTYGAGSDKGFVSFDEMMNVFVRSKINLNFTSTTSIDRYTISPPQINQRIKQAKGRPIEIALAGGFVLSEYAAGIEEMFVIGKEIDIFRTDEELIEKIDYYLNHEEERQEIARAGQERAQKHYDAESGFSFVFNRLADVEQSPKFPSYYDKDFRVSYCSFRFFYLALFLLTGKCKFFFEALLESLRPPRFALSQAYFFFIRGVLYWLRERPKLETVCRKIKKTLHLRVKY